MSGGAQQGQGLRRAEMSSAGRSVGHTLAEYGGEAEYFLRGNARTVCCVVGCHLKAKRLPTKRLVHHHEAVCAALQYHL